MSRDRLLSLFLALSLISTVAFAQVWQSVDSFNGGIEQGSWTATGIPDVDTSNGYLKITPASESTVTSCYWVMLPESFTEGKVTIAFDFYLPAGPEQNQVGFGVGSFAQAGLTGWGTTGNRNRFQTVGPQPQNMAKVPEWTTDIFGTTSQGVWYNVWLVYDLDAVPNTVTTYTKEASAPFRTADLIVNAFDFNDTNDDDWSSVDMFAVGVGLQDHAPPETEPWDSLGAWFDNIKVIAGEFVSPPDTAPTVLLQMSTDGFNWLSVQPGMVTVNGSEVHFRTVIYPADGGDPVYGNPVSEYFPAGGGLVEVSLNRSEDLQGWSATSPGDHAFDSRVFLNVSTSSAMSLIPSGAFIMGSPVDELGRSTGETQHQVTLTRSFLMQQTEVTTTQWNEVRAEGATRGYTDLPLGYASDPSGGHPVTKVSWFDAVKWLNLKSELEGLTPCYTVGGLIYKTVETPPDCNFDANGYRLPTESEWEYACRAGTTTAFYNGPITSPETSPLDPNLDVIGWYGGNSGINSHPVGQKQPNDWAIYDMSGNVFEWCWDEYTAYSGDVTDPTGPPPHGGLHTIQRVCRGGYYGHYARLCRSAFRTFSHQTNDDTSELGFRFVRTASMVLVEGGTFIMHDEVFEYDPNTGRFEISYTQRPTTVSSFYIGTRELTVGQWNRVKNWANANGYDISTTTVGCSDSHPVDDIHINNILKWCNALSELENLEPAYYTDSSQTTVFRMGTVEILNSYVDWEGNGYRLPTEAEWEFAARGGNHSEGYLFSGSDNGYEVGWFSLNAIGSDCPPDWVISEGGSEGPQPGGQLLPNELNIYDMSGNVLEYCWDFRGLLGTEPVENPRGPDPDPGKGLRIYRGGSWLSSGDWPLFDGSDRWAVTPAVGNQFGFRIARNAQP